MKKRKVVIATHGELAKGFVSSLNIIVGGMDDIETVCGYLTPDFNLHQEIQRIMDSFDPQREDLIVFTDLLGGSVNNGFLQALTKYPFHLITNTSLPTLVDILLTMQEVEEEALKQKLETHEFSAMYCNVMLTNMKDSMMDDI